MRSILGLGLALGLAGLASAQPAADRPRPGAGRPRDEAFKMIDAYIMSNLQESLGLTDDQFVKLLPVVKRLQSERRAFAEKRQQMIREVRRQLNSGTATEGQIAETLREIKKVEIDEPAATRRNMDAIDGALSPVQQAKFRVLQVEVELKIRDLMSQMRNEGRARARREGAVPPRQQQ